MYHQTTATTKIKTLSKRIRAIQGGTSASKTVSILIYLIARAQSDKKPTLTSVVAESVPHLKRGAMRDFFAILQAHNYWNETRWNATDSIYTFETGSRIEFFGVDSPDKLRGARRDRLFINEANNVSFNVFEQLEVRTKDFVFLDWNPSNEFWFYTELITKREDDVDHIILTYKDNEALTPEIIASIEARKNRPSWWRVYGLGLLGIVEGRIYTNWNVIGEIPHEARLERYGLDFGYSRDPTAIVAIYYYNGGYILDEICYQTGLLNKPIADIILAVDKALVIADSAEPKSIDELKIHGVNVLPAKKGKDSIRSGISVVQEQRISVTRHSVNLLREYNNYLWAVDKNGKTLSPNEPEGGEDHCLDALRYALTSIRDFVPEHIHTQQNEYFNRTASRQLMNSTK